MPRLTNEQKLAQLNALNSDNPDQLTVVLRERLQDRNNLVVAKAANLCREHMLYDLTPLLVEAFDLFLKDTSKDKNCFAKNAICKALYELDYREQAFYLKGLHYRQPEPAWGGSTDSAVNVRITCALGLTLCSNPRAAVELIELLNDPEAAVRAGAVQAIGTLNPWTAEIILREKVVLGDNEASVLGECFNTLLQIEPDYSLEFVARYLRDNNPEVSEQAIMALGSCHLPEAFEHLKAVWERAYLEPALCRIVLNAIALQRTEPAFDLLLQVIATNQRRMAECVVHTLAMYSHNQPLQEKVQAAIKANGSAELQKFYQDILA